MYPKYAGKLADLLSRIEQSTKRVQAANGPGGPYIQPAANSTLTSVVRLPSMSPLWPPPSTFNPMNVITPQMREFSEARGPEMRRVADVVATKKHDEANAQTPVTFDAGCGQAAKALVRRPSPIRAETKAV